MKADQKIKEEKLYLNPDLVRDDLVRLLAVKRQDFIQAINENTGMTFTDYINNLRLEEALRLLENSSQPTIEEISMNAGFGTVRSFYRQFKEKHNMSPAEYRRQIK